MNDKYTLPYLLELQTRFNLVRAELKCAEAEIGETRKSPAHAIMFVERTISEAEKLKLHLEAWSEYVKQK